jgi:small subunit ribosomal protein S7
MSRRRAAVKSKVTPDAKFGSVIVAKLINYLMLDGKKYVAEVIAYEAIEKLSEKLKKDSVQSFEEVVGLIKPLVEVRSRRVGGSTYQIPVEVKPERQVFKSLKWLIEAAKKRASGRGMANKLFLELHDAYNKKGGAFKKREDTHKMAEANKAFSHFRY